MSPCELIVRRFFDAFEHGEIERMLAVVHPDAVFVPAAPMPGRERLHEHEQIREWARWAAQKRPIMVARSDAFRVLDEDHVLVTGRDRVPFPDGGYADRSAAWIVQVMDGKVRRFEARWTVEEALELHESRTGN